MSQPEPQRDPLEVLAAEFVQRQRNGQSPSISEYAAKHPELAADIEDLFPTIAAMEQLKAQKAEASGARVSLGSPKLERLGDFRILGEIGRGGMGIVYEAFQESLGRHVAVKVLPRQSLLDAKHLQRFERESQTAARLHHTNIVPVFGVGEQDGFHYIVMQLIRGVGLDAILAWIQQACTAPGDATNEDIGVQPPSSSAGETARLANMLMQGRVGAAVVPELGPQLHCRPLIHLSDGSTTPVPTKRAVAIWPRRKRRDVRRQQISSYSRAIVRRGRRQPKIFRPCGAPRSPGAAIRLQARSSARQVFPAIRRLGSGYWRSIAAIGLQVAEALNYAHAQHTLHRDVKPANLLLDSQGVVWITDFGLAKAMEQDNVTQTGGLVGTLRYMAPEQFFGQFDARSDIYSLGLTLYEFLTLRAAFEGASRSSIIQKITHGEPIRPRKLNSDNSPRLGNHRAQGNCPRPGPPLPVGRRNGPRPPAFSRGPADLARRASAVEKVWRWSRRNRVVAALARAR